LQAKTTSIQSNAPPLQTLPLPSQLTLQASPSLLPTASCSPFTHYRQQSFPSFSFYPFLLVSVQLDSLWCALLTHAMLMLPRAASVSP
jgi:hypothetical protein